jgi:hypothetical protein
MKAIKSGSIVQYLRAHCWTTMCLNESYLSTMSRKEFSKWLRADGWKYASPQASWRGVWTCPVCNGVPKEAAKTLAEMPLGVSEQEF